MLLSEHEGYDFTDTKLSKEGLSEQWLISLKNFCYVVCDLLSRESRSDVSTVQMFRRGYNNLIQLLYFKVLHLLVISSQDLWSLVF